MTVETERFDLMPRHRKLNCTSAERSGQVAAGIVQDIEPVLRPKSVSQPSALAFVHSPPTELRA